MQLKNTAQNYGTIAKWLHWSTALLFLLAYMSVYYRHWFVDGKSPEGWTALQLHLSFGISIAVLVVLRVIWRISNRTPDPEPGTKWEHRAAHLGHYALYAVLIIMPLTGYLGTGVDTEFFFLFDIPNFEKSWLFEHLIKGELGLTFKEFEQPIDFIHKQILGKWLAWILIIGHALAALYHHYGKHDRTLLKMTSGN